MMVPSEGLLDFAHLSHIGVNELSLNLEICDQSVAERHMPKKASCSLASRLRTIERAVDAMGWGRVRSMLLVGIEPIDSTIRGVELLAQRGCVPVLSPFRPAPLTPLANMRPPEVSYLLDVVRMAEDAAAKHGMRLGPRCIPCQHNTLTFPDGSGFYHYHKKSGDGKILVVPYIGPTRSAGTDLLASMMSY
jgi:hypothetical protein